MTNWRVEIQGIAVDVCWKAKAANSTKSEHEDVNWNRFEVPGAYVKNGVSALLEFDARVKA